MYTNRTRKRSTPQNIPPRKRSRRSSVPRTEAVLANPRPGASCPLVHGGIVLEPIEEPRGPRSYWQPSGKEFAQIVLVVLLSAALFTWGEGYGPTISISLFVALLLYAVGREERFREEHSLPPYWKECLASLG